LSILFQNYFAGSILTIPPISRPSAREEAIVADVEPEQARQKRVVVVPGKHEVDRVGDRRPDMYGPLV